ncbi:MAG: HlyD protein [Acidobacteria bacterium]|nr:HlyD protein [Acidobacteriota bacterium]
MKQLVSISSCGRGIPFALGGLALLLAATFPAPGWTHGEVAGGGAVNVVQRVTTPKGTYRAELMYSPSQPVAGEPANIELKVVRLLPTPDPLLGSEVPVGLQPHASLLAADSEQVFNPEIHMHTEGEAGVFGIAEYPFPAGGPFLLRSLFPFTGSYRVRFLVQTEIGDEFTVNLPVTVQPDASALFRVWINLALGGLILGLTAMRLRKVREAGGGRPQMVRPAAIGAGALLVVGLGTNVFVLDRVLAMREPLVIPAPPAAVALNEDGSYTIPAAVQKDLGLELAEAKQMQLEQAITAFGTVEPNPSLVADVFAPLWGRIEFPGAPLAVGERVERGKEMVRVILELSAVERAPMEAKQKDIRSALAQAKERRDAAQLAYERAEMLAKSNPAFEQDLKWAEELLDEAEDALQQVTKQDQDYVGVVRFRDPRRTPVVAPLSGTITSVDFVPGQLNLNGEYRKLFTIADTSEVWVRAQTYLSDVWMLRTGQPVKIFPEGAAGPPRAGTVRWIGDTVEPSSRTVPVIITVPNSEQPLALGSFARVEFPQRRRAVAVPEQAVLDDGTTRRVYVAREENRFVLLDVELGVKQDGWWQVIAGLAEGDRVIAKGAGLLGSLRQEQLSGSGSPAPSPEPRQASALTPDVR